MCRLNVGPDTCPPSPPPGGGEAGERPELRTLDQLDPIAVRILDKRDDRPAMRHRTSRPRDLDARRSKALAGPVDIRNTDRQMTEGAAQTIGARPGPSYELARSPYWALVAVTDKGEGKLPGRIIAFAQQLHPKQVGIESQQRVEIADPDHRVQEAELVGCRLSALTYRPHRSPSSRIPP